MWRRLVAFVYVALASMVAVSSGSSYVPVNARGLKRRSRDDIVLTRGKTKAVFAKRLAGAVYRLEWDGHVVIPELEGNGGSLQTALAFDIPVGESPEIENPTEAGSVEDNYGQTTSVWQKAAASDDEIYTKSRLAYYYPPGRRVASSQHRTKARGSSKVSDVTLRKRVSILEDGTLRYRIRLDWKDAHWFVQIQVLAVYLSRDFDTLYVAKDGRALKRDVRSFSSSPPDVARPLIVAKSRDVAVGLHVTKAPDGTYAPETMPWYTASLAGGHKDFGEGLREVDLTAISAVWHGGSQLDESADIPRKVFFEIVMMFGGVDDLAERMTGRQKKLR